MEIDPKLRIIVGVLTLVLAGGAMWMGSGQLDARPGGGEFKVLFLESVEGLSRNSPVTYKGRLVGKVLKISQAKKEDGIYTLVRFGLDANVEVYEQRIEIETVLFKPEGLEDWFAANDVILAVGKKEVDTVRSFTQTLDQWLDDLRLSRSAAPGATVGVKILRAGADRVIQVPYKEGSPQLRFKTQGTRAVLSSNFVTGIKTVQLIGGRSELPVAKTDSFIPADSSALGGFFESISRDGTRIMSNLESLTAEVDALVKDLNREELIQDILRNVKEITEPEAVKKLIANISAAAEEASKTLERIRLLLEENGQINILLAQISAQFEKDGDLSKALAGIQAAFQEKGSVTTALKGIQDVANELQTSLAEGGRINTALKSVQDLLAQLKKDLEPGGQLAARFDELGYILRNDLRRTLAGLSSLAKTLSDTAYRLAHENPSSLIMGAKSEKK